MALAHIEHRPLRLEILFRYNRHNPPHAEFIALIIQKLELNRHLDVHSRTLQFSPH
jgi:hypothetical protein